MKWFALLGLLLFLGMAVAPSINADFKDNLKSNVNSPLFNKRVQSAIGLNQVEKNTSNYIGENSQRIIPILSNVESSKYLKYFSRIDNELKKNPQLMSELVKKLKDNSMIKSDSTIEYIDIQGEFDTLLTIEEEKSKLFSKDYYCQDITIFQGCLIIMLLYLILFLFL